MAIDIINFWIQGRRACLRLLSLHLTSSRISLAPPTLGLLVFILASVLRLTASSVF